MKELYEALFAAQAEFPKLKRDSKNPHFKSKYVSLAGAVESLEPILRKHGLMITQPAAGNGVGTGCTTILAHIASGQEIRETLLLPSAGPGQSANAQTGTAAITYARRTGYIAITGAVLEDDDDGEDAVRGSRPSTGQKTAKQAVKKTDIKADTAKTAAPAPATKQTTSEPAKADKKADIKAAKEPAKAGSKKAAKYDPTDLTGGPAGPGPEKAQIPTELPGATVYPNDEEYEAFRNRAQIVKKALADKGVTDAGKKLMNLFLKKAGVEDAHKITKLQFEAMLKKIETMVYDPKLIDQAVKFVNSCEASS